MPLKIGQRPDHGFDEPLRLLSDCHRRIEHFLSVLTATADRADGRTLSEGERTQLQIALTYFATAAPRHTADEEESLFPRMEASLDRDAIEALNTIQRLESDHDEANRLHEAVDRLVRLWLSDGRLADSRMRELECHLARLNTLYAAHIALEDREVFPAAARILSPSDIHEIGREMAVRRSIRAAALRSNMTDVMVSPPPSCQGGDGT
jgi:hemerythrin-like domain-containing protein